MATIFGELERLITEHGSAAILRERLGLAADQYAALEKKNSDLQAENENLRAQLEHLQKENAELKQAIPRDAGRLGAFDRDTHKVLSFFFQQSDDVSVDQVAMQTGLDRSMVEYHFDLLREAGFIAQTHVGFGPSDCMYGIMPEGRKYAVKNRIQQGH